jgi:SAM-dependent methyltransferase
MHEPMPERAVYRPTERFTSKAEAYARFRPGYPKGLVDELALRGVLERDYVIADIGSGTGLLSDNFIESGHVVYGIEPNAPMSAMAEKRFKDRKNFINIDARAEATTLSDRSIDLIIVGQAFHWFEPAPSRVEFKRILRKGRAIAIVWNERQNTSSGFMTDYDRLLDKHCERHGPMDRMEDDKNEVASFFSPGTIDRFTLPNWQELDLGGAIGRLTSSSYAPNPGQPGYDEIVADLKDIFERYQTGGLVRFIYDTEVYLGRFEP